MWPRRAVFRLRYVSPRARTVHIFSLVAVVWRVCQADAAVCRIGGSAGFDVYSGSHNRFRVSTSIILWLLIMTTSLDSKSTIDEIRDRFDGDVERFSNLETGQSATIDAPLAMELITQAAVASSSPIGRVLDIGCGAGNNTIRLRQVAAIDEA